MKKHKLKCPKCEGNLLEEITDGVTVCTLMFKKRIKTDRVRTWSSLCKRRQDILAILNNPCISLTQEKCLEIKNIIAVIDMFEIMQLLKEWIKNEKS